MDPEQLAFIAAICRDPADDLPRLVYADWLEERAGTVACGRCDGKGGAHWYESGRGPWLDCKACSGTGHVSNGYAERAEFIRVQCELAKYEGINTGPDGGASGPGSDQTFGRPTARGRPSAYAGLPAA